jgi:hypothetical protein
MRDAWEGLLADARWAPSPHNGQQWRLRPTSPSRAQLLCDPSRLVPAIDPQGAFSMVGIGAFVETLAVVARAGGLDLALTNVAAPPSHERAGPAPVADLELVPGGSDHLTIDLIHRRRTSRLAYDGRPVDARLSDRLNRESSRFGHRTEASSEPDLVRWALDLDGRFLLRDLRDAAALKELAEWLRYSHRSAARSGDGFSPATMDVPGWMLWALAHSGPLLRLPPSAAIVRRLHAASVRGTATVAWLAGPFATPSDWISAGRAFARVWLEMTAEGIYLQPLGSIIDAPSVHARLNPNGDGTVWIVVRMGTGPEPARSHRLAVDELLI